MTHFINIDSTDYLTISTIYVFKYYDIKTWIQRYNCFLQNQCKNRN